MVFIKGPAFNKSHANAIKSLYRAEIAPGLILSELISNAIKYACEKEQEGQVRVDLKVLSTGDIELSVSDTGRGLSEDIHISNAESTGFVLVRNLTDQLGGKMKIENSREPG